ncbi:hypothetical protein M9M90_16970 [Phenylobacterium sp. LH3H17]|uniref:hypothetical protein n=1 Tax=Phenylobacterium sp. LH3H17 TaxID=2903901 RepID=UPI0020C94A6A|nr:hypothetical protein [Phenylobacterium sp. LH3H17]UTP38896.1 hypothetical protein M9M90_16970 [Phenylobacterium sp. LH3H17]
MSARAILAIAALATLAPVAGQASSPDAWAAFRADVAARCLSAAQATGMKTPEVIVHPLGTEAYGIAVLREGADKRICIYGKQSKKVELTPAT